MMLKQKTACTQREKEDKNTRTKRNETTATRPEAEFVLDFLLEDLALLSCDNFSCLQQVQPARALQAKIRETNGNKQHTNQPNVRNESSRESINQSINQTNKQTQSIVPVFPSTLVILV